MRTITTSLTPLAHCMTTFAAAATRRLSTWILAAAVLAAVPGVSDVGSLRAQELPSGFCLNCMWERWSSGDWHWTTGLASKHAYGWGVDGGEHSSLKPGNCDVKHGICVIIMTDAHELTKEISDAVAANDIESLAKFAAMPVGQSVCRTLGHTGGGLRWQDDSRPRSGQIRPCWTDDRGGDRRTPRLLTRSMKHAPVPCLSPSGCSACQRRYALPAQEPEVVSGQVTCGDCVITLDTVVTIGGLSGPGLHVIDRFSGVAVDRRGRFLINGSGPPEISVFDSTGKFLRTVGRRGEGPGEYRSIRHIAVGPQYIHVFDFRAGRTMLDHDFAVVRTDRFPGAIDYSVVRSDDEVVFAADVPTPESVGHQLHVLRPSGELVSYGYEGRRVSIPFDGPVVLGVGHGRQRRYRVDIAQLHQPARALGVGARTQGRQGVRAACGGIRHGYEFERSGHVGRPGTLDHMAYPGSGMDTAGLSGRRDAVGATSRMGGWLAGSGRSRNRTDTRSSSSGRRLPGLRRRLQLRGRLPRDGRGGPVSSHPGAPVVAGFGGQKAMIQGRVAGPCLRDVPGAERRNFANFIHQMKLGSRGLVPASRQGPQEP